MKPAQPQNYKTTKLQTETTKETKQNVFGRKTTKLKKPTAEQNKTTKVEAQRREKNYKSQQVSEDLLIRLVICYLVIDK